MICTKQYSPFPIWEQVIDSQSGNFNLPARFFPSRGQCRTRPAEREPSGSKAANPMFSRTYDEAARALEIAQAARAQLEKHEAVCAERYTEIREALQSIRVFLTRSVLSLVAGLLLTMGAILLRLFEARGIL